MGETYRGKVRMIEGRRLDPNPSYYCGDCWAKVEPKYIRLSVMSKVPTGTGKKDGVM